VFIAAKKDSVGLDRLTLSSLFPVFPYEVRIRSETLLSLCFLHWHTLTRMSTYKVILHLPSMSTGTINFSAVSPRGYQWIESGSTVVAIFRLSVKFGTFPAVWHFGTLSWWVYGPVPPG